jgi:restriction endonuclease S subunit
VKLGEVCRVESGFGFPVDDQGLTDEDIPFVKVGDMNLPGNERTIMSARSTISRTTAKRLKAEIFPIGTVIFPKIGAAIATNKKRVLGCEATIDNNVMGLVPTGLVIPEYLLAYMQGINLSAWASQAQPPSMRKSDVETHEIPLPDRKTQQKVAAELEAERALVEANRKLVELFEKKIQSKLAEIWGSGDDSRKEAQE